MKWKCLVPLDSHTHTLTTSHSGMGELFLSSQRRMSFNLHRNAKFIPLMVTKETHKANYLTAMYLPPKLLQRVVNEQKT